jgi:transposase-like protein
MSGRGKRCLFKKKRYSAEEKARVAIEAIKGQKTLNELAAEYGVHPSQITQWKKQALEEIGMGFSGGRGRRERSDEALIGSLYQEIGQLKVELDWLKKSQSAVWKRRGR